MFSFKKRHNKVADRPYKVVAVRPSTHAKLIEMANERNRTIIDIVAEKVGA